MKKLQWFNDLLKERLEQKEISLNQYSKAIDMPYASLHRILSGQQNITEKDLGKMLSPTIFFQDDLAMLRESFDLYNITKEERQSVESIGRMFDNIASTMTPIIIRDVLQQSEDTQVQQVLGTDIAVMNQTSALLIRAYHEAVENAKRTGRKVPFLIRGRLPVVENIYEGVYQAFRTLLVEQKEAGADGVEIDAELVVSFDTSVSFVKQMKNLKIYELVSRFLAFEMFDRMTYLAYPNASDTDQYFIYQYYLIAGDSMINYNSDGQSAIVSGQLLGEQSLAVESYRQQHKRLPVSGDLMTHFSLEEINNHKLEIQERGNYLTTDSYMLRYTFSSMVLPLEIFNGRLDRKLESLQIKNISDFSKAITSILATRQHNEHKKIQSKNATVTSFYVAEGIKDFFRTGLVSDFLEVLGVIEPYERAVTLLEILEQINKGLEVRILSERQIAENPFLNFAKFFEIYVDAGEVIVARQLDQDEAVMLSDGGLNLAGRSINHAIILEQPDIIEAIKKFCELVLTRLAMSTEESFAYIQEMGLFLLKDSTESKTVKKLEQVGRMKFMR